MHPSAIFAGFEQPGVAEGGEVFGNRGVGEVEEFDELADAAFLV